MITLVLAACWLVAACPEVCAETEETLLEENWRLRAAAHPVPPMGWMSWYRGGFYGTGPTESLIRTVVDQMLTNGWRQAGYRYINIDAGWSATNRLSDGRITWNETKFPSGLPALVGFCHEKGFKVGIYTEPNEFVEGRAGVGSLGHFEEDAQSFADWEIDYIKFDPRVPPRSESFVQDFAMAVARTGRPMFLHSYLQTTVDEWVPRYLNSFRKGLDIAGPNPPAIWSQFMSNVCGAMPAAPYVRPGFYLDLETIPLSIANGWHKPEWLRGILSMYSILAAPMILSTVESPILHPTDALAQDPDIIRIDQDPAVNPPRLVVSNGVGGMVWVRALGDPGHRNYAVCLFNSDTEREQPLTISWDSIGSPTNHVLRVYDCWFKTNCFAQGTYTRNILPGSAAMLRLQPWTDAAETGKPCLTVIGLRSNWLEVAISGRRTVLECSSDTRTWSPVATNLTSSVPWVYSERVSSGKRACFYRAYTCD